MVASLENVRGRGRRGKEGEGVERKGGVGWDGREERGGVDGGVW